MLLKLLIKLIYKLGMLPEKYEKKRYTPRYEGQWVNKGTDKDERWVWIEKNDGPYYVNVFNLEDDYILTVGRHPRGNAIETIDCIDLREVEIALEYLSIYYRTFGNVITYTESETNQDWSINLNEKES
jgi:hypothetical protein